MGNISAAVAEAKRSRSNSSNHDDGTLAAPAYLTETDKCLDSITSHRLHKDLLGQAQRLKAVHAGRRSSAQAVENVAAAEIELTPDEISWLNLHSDAR